MNVFISSSDMRDISGFRKDEYHEIVVKTPYKSLKFTRYIANLPADVMAFASAGELLTEDCRFFYCLRSGVLNL
jgi:hypothetical protein